MADLRNGGTLEWRTQIDEVGRVATGGGAGGLGPQSFPIHRDANCQALAYCSQFPFRFHLSVFSYLFIVCKPCRSHELSVVPAFMGFKSKKATKKDIGMDSETRWRTTKTSSKIQGC